MLPIRGRNRQRLQPGDRCRQYRPSGRRGGASRPPHQPTTFARILRLHGWLSARCSGCEPQSEEPDPFHGVPPSARPCRRGQSEALRCSAGSHEIRDALGPFACYRRWQAEILAEPAVHIAQPSVTFRMAEIQTHQAAERLILQRPTPVAPGQALQAALGQGTLPGARPSRPAASSRYISPSWKVVNRHQPPPQASMRDRGSRKAIARPGDRGAQRRPGRLDDLGVRPIGVQHRFGQ